jgi:low affinity Fe/Cu permease
MPRKRSIVSEVLEKFSYQATRATGTSIAFVLAVGVIVIWAITGPIFGFSDTWQLVINTGTTIVTFLMVFLIQRAQNKDALAIHLKLNEIVAALEGASNRLIDVEDLTEPEIDALRNYYKKPARTTFSPRRIRSRKQRQDTDRSTRRSSQKAPKARMGKRLN